MFILCNHCVYLVYAVLTNQRPELELSILELRWYSLYNTD